MNRDITEQRAIDRVLRQNYTKYPYPNDLQNLDGGQDQRHLEMYQLYLRSLNLSLEQVTNGLILDVGCGTGDTAIRRFARWGARTVCVDITMEPLHIAKRKVDKFALSGVWFVSGSALKLPFPDKRFDVVHSCGVLHHTGDAYVGFREMLRVCKKGGVVIVGVYNKFGGFRRTVQRNALRLIAGNNQEKQMALAENIFAIPRRGEMPLDVYLNDRCGHPIESKHSYGEVLEWFERHNVEYVGSHPSLYFRKFWNVLLQQLMTSKNPKIQRVHKFMPKMFFKEGTEGTPHIMMKFITQTLMLITGQEMLNVAGIRR